jgi:hypothetical protein
MFEGEREENFSFCGIVMKEGGGGGQRRNRIKGLNIKNRNIFF